MVLMMRYICVAIYVYVLPVGYVKPYSLPPLRKNQKDSEKHVPSHKGYLYLYVKS